MYYVGIDIAKSFHVVSVIDDEETKVINKPFKINNDAKGFEKLLTILDSVTLDKSEFTIGLEATGIYGENLLCLIFYLIDTELFTVSFYY